MNGENNIRRLREAGGYTLTEVAKKINVSPAYLSMIERGTKCENEHA